MPADTNMTACAHRRARHLLSELARCGHVDMLHESPAVAAEVMRLLEHEASRAVARLTGGWGSATDARR